MMHRIVAIIVLVMFAGLLAQAQQSRWAEPNDPTAKFMIDAERQWAEAACNHNKIAQTILADDFQGTSTDGKRYDKSREMADMADTSKSARDCRLDEARVRFFGDNLAIVYGGERSIRKGNDGKEKPRCQVWTDTWLKRNGKWQIIAAHDALVDCK